MTINSLILGLTAYPRVVKKAQEELDRVVGKSRMPTFDDAKDLPYIHAMVKEVRV
jgi:cytochrome P450